MDHFQIEHIDLELKLSNPAALQGYFWIVKKTEDEGWRFQPTETFRNQTLCIRVQIQRLMQSTVHLTYCGGARLHSGSLQVFGYSRTGAPSNEWTHIWRSLLGAAWRRKQAATF